jgi:hypothetical protein
MDRITRRPDSILDWLYTQHTDNYRWFEFAGEEVYANLVVADGYAKPTEQECIDGLAQMQADFDAKDYQRSRASAYPSIADQLDQIYHEGIDAWKETIAAVKAEYPKP